MSLRREQGLHASICSVHYALAVYLLDDPRDYSPRHGAPCVALGNFDGVHLGHQELFRRARSLAEAKQGEALVLTFSPHPAQVLSPARAPALIDPPAERYRQIQEAGLNVVLQSFDSAFAALAPEVFVQQVLVEALGAQAVFVGQDFTFGRAREGSSQSLVELGAKHGFEVYVVPPVEHGGEVISSSRIRRLIESGAVELAESLLGRPFRVYGTVESGAGRGSSIGIPTANIRSETSLWPRAGVFAARVWVEETSYLAAVNVGVAPTFGSRETLLEAHLLDASVELKGQRISVALHVRIRDERRFSGPAALVEQIHADIADVRAALAPAP